MKKKFDTLDTKLIHAGEPLPRFGGAVVLPIFQSAMLEQIEGVGYHDLGYIRLNNSPNHKALHEKLAALENAEAGLVTASGMAAISTTILTMLGGGGHMLVQDSLYGGTHDFLTQDLPSLGSSFDFIDAENPASWKALLQPNTRAIYTETLTNPTMKVADHLAVIAFAREHGLVSMIDNTFASPVNFRPIEHGYDLALHSCTKYLNGHSDIVAGAVLGGAGRVREITLKLNHLGGSLDPHACFLLHRGIKTLGVRMRYQNQSALEIARYLETRAEVNRVNYSGLESHPGHARAAALFDGHGGVLSFELKDGGAAARNFIKHTSLPVHTFSLGGVETLIIQPAKSSHAGMSPRDREKIGVTEGLIRLSVGLEATADLIRDFERAFAAL